MRKLKLGEIGRISNEEFKSSEKHDIILILDNIRSFHNTGAVFRSADAFRIEGIVLCGYTPCPPHREIHKTALGAENSVPWKFEKDPLAAILELKNNGRKIYALEHTDQSMSLSEFNFCVGDKIALILGNEVEGVRDEILSQCDGAIEIPQFGTKHSLNVSVAAGIVLYDLVSGLRDPR